MFGFGKMKLGDMLEDMLGSAATGKSGNAGTKRTVNTGRKKTGTATEDRVYTLYPGCDYTIVRSDRKSIALEIKSDGRLLVRAPRRMALKDIQAFVASKEGWIRSHQSAAAQANADTPEVRALTETEMKALIAQARKVIPQRVAYYAPKVGVTYGRITIRHQKTRWGSCSSEGNLNFNCLLMLTPQEVIDSVVVHELCHRKEMNHSKRFYAEVYKVYPEYDKWHKWLKSHGAEIMRRNA